MTTFKITILHSTHSLLNFTGEDMNLELFSAGGAFSKCKAVTFQSSILPTDTEQYFVDWERSDFCTTGLIYYSKQEGKMTRAS